jgi:hypothetical protein
MLGATWVDPPGVETIGVTDPVLDCGGVCTPATTDAGFVVGGFSPFASSWSPGGVPVVVVPAPP